MGASWNHFSNVIPKLPANYSLFANKRIHVDAASVARPNDASTIYLHQQRPPNRICGTVFRINSLPIPFGGLDCVESASTLTGSEVQRYRNVR